MRTNFSIEDVIASRAQGRTLPEVIELCIMMDNDEDDEPRVLYKTAPQDSAGEAQAEAAT